MPQRSLTSNIFLLLLCLFPLAAFAQNVPPITQRVIYSHEVINQICPRHTRTLEVINSLNDQAIIRSNSSWWRYGEKLNCSVSNSVDAGKGGFLIAPEHNLAVKFSLGVQSSRITAYCPSTNLFVGFLNATDLVLTFFFGQKIPKDLFEADKTLAPMLLEEISGATITAKLTPVVLASKEFWDKWNEESATSVVKTDALLKFFKSFVESAGNADLFSLYRKLSAKAGVNLTSGQLNLFLDELKKGTRIVDLAKYACDAQRTPNAESVTIIFSSTTPPTGLIAYYPFNGNANDESGNGNHGTNHGAMFANGVCLITGNQGELGSGKYIEVPNVVNGLSQLSISLWVKEYNMSYPDGESYISFGSYDENSVGIISIAHEAILHATPSQGSELRFYVTNGGAISTARMVRIPWVDSFSNSDQHLVLVFNGTTGTLRAYRNGDLIGTENIQPGRTTVANHGAIAKHWATGVSTTRFNGVIDDVRLYNRALLDDEVRQLHSQGHGSK